MVDAKTLYPTTPSRDAEPGRPDGGDAGRDREETQPLDLAIRGTQRGLGDPQPPTAKQAVRGQGAEMPGGEADETAPNRASESAGAQAPDTAELTPEQRTALFYTAPDGPVATAGQVSLGLAGFFDGLQASLADAPERRDQAAEAERRLPAALSAAGLAAGDLRELTGLMESYLRTAGDAEKAEATPSEETERRQQRDYARAEAKLRETFGPRAGPLLADARAAVALVERRSPGFRDWLDATGAGNDPRILRAAIRAGRRLRGEGRL
ncbi:hypothetical protein [Algihabitans sp.]|uniref:hypothetical protein n=1 Tax=Algihabitans sp. TaxID=2821514 RepID=UPI003BAD6643